MKILFLTPQAPWLSQSGGSQHSLERLKSAITEKADITVGCLKHPSLSANPNKEGVEVLETGYLKPRSISTLLRSYFQNLPLSVSRNWNLDLANIIKPNKGYDLIYCDHWLMWPYTNGFNGIPKILNLHNAEHVQFSRAAETLRFPLNILAKLEATRVLSYLKKIGSQATETHVISSQDLIIMERDGVKFNKTRILLPASKPPVSINTINPITKTNTVLYIGSLSWAPNIEGLNWFLEKVWPLVHNGVLKVIGGGAPTSLIDAIARAGGEYLGFVEDVRPYESEAKVFIAPLLSGSGIKLKILNGMAAGIPTVTTKIGVEGFPDPASAISLSVTDDPVAYAKYIEYNLGLPPEDWILKAADAINYVTTNFSGNNWLKLYKDDTLHA